MKPYYDHAGIQIFHGDCREILPQLPKGLCITCECELADEAILAIHLAAGHELSPFLDVLVADPQYGIAHPTDYAARGRGKLAACSNYLPVHGDDKPFDPAHLLALNMPTVLWGGNHYSSRLPDSSGWLVWDKERPDALDQATCELAWSNFIKGVRRFRYLWNGMIRAGNETLLHPTQKPIALMKWVLTLPWTPEGTVLDAYMGGGSTLIAAKDLGRRAIGIEIEEKYCEIAAKRLSQEVLDFSQ